jgi:hypothetical protein
MKKIVIKLSKGIQNIEKTILKKLRNPMKNIMKRMLINISKMPSVGLLKTQKNVKKLKKGIVKEIRELKRPEPLLIELEKSRLSLIGLPKNN